jgi:TctA family transporter
VPGLHVNNVALLLVGAAGPLTAVLAAVIPTSLVPLGLAALLLAAATAHTSTAFLPSVFLGAPEEDTALSVLPGHRMLRQGRGREAVALAAWGAFLGTLASLALLLPVRLLLGPPVEASEYGRWLVPAVLLVVLLLLLLGERGRTVHRLDAALRCLTPEGIIVSGKSVAPRELGAGAVVIEGSVTAVGPAHLLIGSGDGPRRVLCSFQPSVKPGERVTVCAFVGGSRFRSALEQRGLALMVFLLAGGLGFLVLGAPGFWAGPRLLPIPPGQAALLPLFAGLFGVPSILLGRGAVESTPPQRDPGPLGLPLWRRVRAVLAGTVSGATVSAFPAMSGGVATVVARQLAGGGDEEADEAGREFLLANGAVNAAMALFSVVALFLLGRTRSGAAAGVAALAGTARWGPLDQPPLLLAAVLLAAALAATLALPLTIRLSRGYAALLRGARARTVSDAVLAFLIGLTAAVAGAAGLAVLGVATAIGCLPPLLAVRRLHLMGCLVVPVLQSHLGYL